MKSRIRVLCVLDYYLPGFRGGGPLRTIANMRAMLSDEVELAIFTRDRDLGVGEPYQDIVPDCWLETEFGPTFYASPSSFGVEGLRLAMAAQRFDILYLNSFFGGRSSIFPLLWARRACAALPVLLAPRGEFSPGALSLKRFKKSLYISLARALGLYRNVHWHASTDGERNAILSQFPAARLVHLAEDPVALGAPVCATLSRDPHAGGRLRLVFISRISPMKNLDGLLEILSGASVEVDLDIYGPIEDAEYWARCRDKMGSLPPNVRAAYQGELAPEAVATTFARYDLFAFPTLGENFGHVVFEAASAGTQILLSDQTPWANDPSGAINVVALEDVAAWRQAIDEAGMRSAGERTALRAATRAFAENYVRSSGTRTRNLAMFEAVCALRRDDRRASANDA